MVSSPPNMVAFGESKTESFELSLNVRSTIEEYSCGLLTVPKMSVEKSTCSLLERTELSQSSNGGFTLIGFRSLDLGLVLGI